MRNIKLVIEYDGTAYNGWQSQKNGMGIEDVIKKAVYVLTDEDVKLIGSGRTDAGVHACGQVANFFTVSSIPGDKFAFALNSKLPYDIVIRESCEVSADFHARYSAVRKTYRYVLYNSVMPSALLYNRTCHVSGFLDLEKMKDAAGYLVGTHDFDAFRAKGSFTSSTIRTIYDINIGTEGMLINIDVTGNGFLYNMVRIIAGTLVYVGTGKIDPVMIKDIIQKRNRVLAGKTLIPGGLYLMKVDY